MGRHGLTLLVCVVLAGCTGQEPADTRGRHPDVTLVKAGTLTVCTDIPYPPFVDDEGGRVVGFDADLMRLVAEELGVKLTMRDTAFDGIRSGQSLAAGECDAAAAAIPIRPELAEVMDFSDGYFTARQAMVVKKGKPYRSLADLRGRKVGVEVGTSGAAYVKDQNQRHKLGLRIVPYEDVDAEQQAVLTGQVEAAVNDEAFWSAFLDQHRGTLEVAAAFDTGERYGVAVKKGNDRLRTVINGVLTAAKRDGRYADIYRKWFGNDPGD